VTVLGAVVALAALAVATVAGLVWRARSGRVTGRARAEAAQRLPAGLVEDGQVTLLHFSSATCAPCRRVRAVCADLAEELQGVRHVELDAEAHLDAIRALNVWRLPTLFVVDRRGTVTSRTVGVPERSALEAAVTEVLAA
jgi:thiol-disulfide isomerase/thioredoxin